MLIKPSDTVGQPYNLISRLFCPALRSHRVVFGRGSDLAARPQWGGASLQLLHKPPLSCGLRLPKTLARTLLGPLQVEEHLGRAACPPWAARPSLQLVCLCTGQTTPDPYLVLLPGENVPSGHTLDIHCDLMLMLLRCAECQRRSSQTLHIPVSGLRVSAGSPAVSRGPAALQSLQSASCLQEQHMNLCKAATDLLCAMAEAGQHSTHCACFRETLALSMLNAGHLRHNGSRKK